ncbi:hypothetical protein KIKIMORA_02730 [Brevundimonas phage vB_BpoS-Kikimora]|uniref:Uncharacterized protein n=1 Tax=Brevundimonas phage vB_BpoS-Kikimora TaxID=2948601 RepID=A0A9E7MS38_9CAUD|nr:hypothetical protein KIKIMORA_02730 [Brevundimonas phage vB_BpoS-Kikimora]
MAALNDFLSALFAGSQDPIRLVYGDRTVDLDGPEDLSRAVEDAAEEPIYLAPLTLSGEAPFLYTVMDNAVEDQWQDERLKPTAVLFKDGTMILVYALQEPAAHSENLDALAADMGVDLNDPIPTPGANGWDMLYCDPDVFTTVQEIDELYAPAELPEAIQPVTADAAAPWESEDYGQIKDARLLTPLDLEDPAYAQEMVISIGAGVDSKKWAPKTMTVANFLGLLSEHHVSPHKDGFAFVLAEILGDQRKKTAVSKCYGIGLDIDVGVTGAVIDAALKELGCLAVRYTTHSNGKTKSRFPKNRLVKWADKNNADVSDPEDLARFLREEEHWDEALIASVEYIGDEQLPEGLMAFFSHDPFPKHRIVLPLAEPFAPAFDARTHEEGMRKWGDLCRALARSLGLVMDKSAVDPSRLFYFPRHPAGLPFDTSFVGGPLLNWRDLELNGEGEALDPGSYEAQLLNDVSEGEDKAKTKSKSTTEKGRKLGKWSIKCAGGFQIVDLIRDHAEDRIRTNGANKIDIECPFDDEHSNAGDPEDRACFAVNAGDGPSDIFTLKCQHDSCAERTNLDFLGKMIEDGWFDEELIHDEAYNALLEEGAEPASPEAAKIIQEEDARADYEHLVDALEETSSDAQVSEAMRAVINANLNPRAATLIHAKLKKKLGVTEPNLKKMLKLEQREMTKESNIKADIKDPKGRFVFAYENDFNFDEAFDACFKTLLKTNERDQEPVFSCVQDQLVRLTRNQAGRISFDTLDKDGLWAELNRRMTFMRRTDQGDGTRDPVPEAVSKYVLEQAYTELPQSPEIIYTPLFTADGSLVVTPGYKPELNLLMANTKFSVDVPVQPNAQDVEDAINFLRNEVLVDFPFLDYDLNDVESRAPSEANCLAMIITPFMRRMINGCTPVFFVAKPTPGTGGTLLGKLPMLIFDGAESAPMRYTQNEEEMQKALLAAIIETRSHLFFDDVVDFNNRSLLQSITAQEIGGRMLGVSRNVSRPNLFNWVATGNNPHVRSEMERRICWVRLNALTPDIQKRKFKHDNFAGFVTDNRAIIIGHILTLIQYWIDSGMPMFEERRRASFEDWSRKVGGVLMCAGVEGFLNNRPPAAADMEESANKAFVREWLRKFTFEKVSPSKLFEHAMAMEMDIIEGNNDDQKKQRFPKKLHALNGRVFVFNNIQYVIRSGSDAEGDPVYNLSRHDEHTEPTQDAA